MSDTMVSIKKSLHEHYKKRIAMLNALEAGGVDNWEWYSESLSDWYKKYEPEELDEEEEED